MFKLLGLVLGVVSVVATGYIVFESKESFNQLSKQVLLHEEDSHGHVNRVEHKEKIAGHEEKTEGHGESSSGGHGGGHGESSAGGHGGGHAEGVGGREMSSMKGMIPFISLDEVFANLGEDKITHTLAVKLDIEFFNTEAKQIFKSRQSMVKDLIIQTSREQEYERLSSLSGKLYYKELLVRRINEHFKEALVKDVHIASFFLQ